MNKVLLICFLFFFQFTFAQQQHVIDSLERELTKQTDQDTSRINTLNSIGWEYRNTNPQKASKAVKEARVISNKLDYKKGKAFSTYLLGVIEDFQGNYDEAIKYYENAIHQYEELKDKRGLASCLNNLGGIHSFKGNYDKSLNYYFKSLSLKEQLSDKKGIAKTLNNIGVIYENKKEFHKALEYYQKSLTIKLELEDKNALATSYSNIGGIYQLLGKNDIALENYMKSVRLYEETNNINGLALTYNSIGSLHLALKDYQKAMQYQKKALELQQKSGDKWGMAYSLFGIGDILYKSNRYKEAIEYLNKGVELAKEIGAVKEQMDGYKLLADAHSMNSDYKKAFEAQKKQMQLQDSLTKTESNKAIAEMQTKYETAQKEKEIEKLNKDQAVKELEFKRERTVKNFLAGLAVLILILAVALYRGFKIKHRSNKLLSAQRDKLEFQKKIIEEKNREINESIEYAKYIQDAVLPAITIQQLLPDSFILYLPKDIVSGDFFWFEEDKEGLYIAVADCTGHGIPGAFMTLVGTILLNEIFNEKKVRTPGEMLSNLNRLLKISLKQTDESFTNRNGMDISICKLNKKTLILETAAANRPIWIIKNNEPNEMLVIEPDKTSIGGMTTENFKFKTNQLSLQKDDIFYLFSDGFSDQFGGEHGKKFMTKQLKDQLLSVSHKPMFEQKTFLANSFASWKNGYQQVDDVLVIGGRV